ncbi:MAG TPA: hypothetical protein VN841_29945 [Bryobacteraceae bacterium]|nr:hypothetical protein [Bryobacteraceae bacterium]
MEMVRLLLVCAGIIPVVASAADFTLTVGPPVAAGSGSKVTKSKAAVFAVRLEECDALDKAQISGTTEGIVDGARMSTPVALSAAESPGVYVVSPAGNQGQGVWVVSLSATCGSARAGAIVPLGTGTGGAGFLRERTRVFPRTPTKAEVDAALKALEAPGK